MSDRFENTQVDHAARRRAALPRVNWEALDEFVAVHRERVARRVADAIDAIELPLVDDAAFVGPAGG